MKARQLLSYNPKKVESFWQKRWKESKLYTADHAKPGKYYVLVELTYSSGDLHMGHWFAWSAPDAYARFKRMQGKNVLFPVGGFDSFGLPAENAAIKKGIHPRDWTSKNIKRMRKQFATMGPSFDWESEVITSSKEYYRWTQWLFLQLFKAGLAYRDKVTSNWCPKCKTVLANEHVFNGCCWRHSDTQVEQKKVDQWLFRITDYADKLIWPSLAKAHEGKPKKSQGSPLGAEEERSGVDWPASMVEGQNNWIGRSEGVEIKFSIVNSQFSISVFTTRLDTIFGATFLLLAPEHPLALKITKKKYSQKVKKYIKRSQKKLERERLAEAKEKTGVFTGNYAVNPANGKKIPVWIADSVLMEYGTGAIMAVPAHDARDKEFAKKYKLKIRKVIRPFGKSKGKLKKAFEDYGILVNSGEYSGLKSETAIKKIAKDLSKKRKAKERVQYHLRDWTISRQRYWGAPIPMIYCSKCARSGRSWFAEKGKRQEVKGKRLLHKDRGDWNHYGWWPVAEKDLPVRLPYRVDYTPRGMAPLATASAFVNTKCPECGGKARRETETMDTYVDSSWYFLRYPDPAYDKGPFNPKLTRQWLPLNIYFGGPEHILGHTLYARFITKVLHDLGYLDFDEFALVRRNHGVILGPDGARMSKSRENVVNPDTEVAKYGADSVRLFLCFIGPHDKGGPWSREGIEGMYRFLGRVWRLFSKYEDIVLVEEKDSREVYIKMHQTIKKVTKDINDLKFNTAIAAIMEYVNLLREKAGGKIKRAKGRIRCAEWDEALKVLVKLLAPFAPHISEEIWVNVLGEKFSTHTSSWPKFVPGLIREEMVTIPVQVNGRLRATLELTNQESRIKSRVVKLAESDERIKKWLLGKKVQKTIFVPAKLINFVIR